MYLNVERNIFQTLGKKYRRYRHTKTLGKSVRWKRKCQALNISNVSPVSINNSHSCWYHVRRKRISQWIKNARAPAQLNESSWRTLRSAPPDISLAWRNPPLVDPNPRGSSPWVALVTPLFNVHGRGKSGRQALIPGLD